MRIKKLFIHIKNEEILEVDIDDTINSIISKVEQLDVTILNTTGTSSNINGADVVIGSINMVSYLSEDIVTVSTSYIDIKISDNKIGYINIYIKQMSDENKKLSKMQVDNKIKNLYDTLLNWHLTTNKKHEVIELDGIFIIDDIEGTSEAISFFIKNDKEI